MKWAQEKHTEYNSELGVREAHIKFLSRENLRLLVFLKDTGQFMEAS
ncbi:hypothetical protein [Paenibacillus sp. L3-i20]|nr:hypothetical protein [Paenibacillus sp. L3-i20]GKU76610.1 hypothetical protein L3i20_v210070 [Paenibacillus sp. L3-i20]